MTPHDAKYTNPGSWPHDVNRLIQTTVMFLSPHLRSIWIWLFFFLKAICISAQQLSSQEFFKIHQVIIIEYSILEYSLEKKIQIWSLISFSILFLVPVSVLNKLKIEKKKQNTSESRVFFFPLGNINKIHFIEAQFMRKSKHRNLKKNLFANK